MAAFMLLEQRRLVEALEALDLYYTTRHEEPLNLLALGTGAKIRLLLGDRDGAAAALSQAEALLRRLGRSNVAPYHQSAYLVSQFLFDLTALEELPDGAGRRGRWALARRARRSARQAVAIARRIAREQPEVYRLAGHLAWASRRPARAVSLWSRSLAMARRLGMRPELARTYFEAGQRLANARGSLILDGKDAAGCIETARALFEELGLEWDLARVVAQRRHAA
ncbi:MAG: hypothetical protein E6J77_03880 [Deltaproteobacteria bacterium]|nr:MAG: hypothetical protein E6J77_03880 [Deltaproteobacteria bacterium]